MHLNERISAWICVFLAATLAVGCTGNSPFKEAKPLDPADINGVYVEKNQAGNAETSEAFEGSELRIDAGQMSYQYLTDEGTEQTTVAVGTLKPGKKSTLQIVPSADIQSLSNSRADLQVFQGGINPDTLFRVLMVDPTHLAITRIEGHKRFSQSFVKQDVSPLQKITDRAKHFRTVRTTFLHRWEPLPLVLFEKITETTNPLSRTVVKDTDLKDEVPTAVDGKTGKLMLTFMKIQILSATKAQINGKIAADLQFSYPRNGPDKDKLRLKIISNADPALYIPQSIEGTESEDTDGEGIKIVHAAEGMRLLTYRYQVEGNSSAKHTEPIVAPPPTEEEPDQRKRKQHPPRPPIDRDCAINPNLPKCRFHH